MSEQNVEIVRSLYEEWRQGRFWRGDLYDPDIEFVMEGDLFPDSGTYYGVTAMRDAWLGWLSAWDNFHNTEPELIDLGDRVVGLYTIRARGKTSGLAVEMPVANILTLRDGRIVQLRLLSREQALREAGISE